MTRKEFCDELAEIMEVDAEIAEDTKLTDFEEFDSLVIMSLVALISSKFGKKVPGTELQKVSNPAELMKLIGDDLFTA